MTAEQAGCAAIATPDGQVQYRPISPLAEQPDRCVCPRGPLCGIAGHECPYESETAHRSLISCKLCDWYDEHGCGHGSCLQIAMAWCAGDDGMTGDMPTAWHEQQPEPAGSERHGTSAMYAAYASDDVLAAEGQPQQRGLYEVQRAREAADEQ